MLAMLAASVLLGPPALSASSTPATPPPAGRAVVRHSRIRRPGPGGSTAFGSTGEWAVIGLQPGLSAASAVPEAGVVIVRAPERGFPGLSQSGPTGLLLVPSGRVLRSAWWAAGLHRGVVKTSVGIWGVGEAGATAPDIYENLNSDDWGSRTILFVKVSGELFGQLGRDEYGMAPAWRGLVPVPAAGIENSPYRDAETVYGAATWDWRLIGIQADLHAGWGTGRFNREAFFGLGLVPSFLLGSTLKLTGEYAGQRGISGLRFAISRTLRLDFGMQFAVVPRPAPRDGWSITMDGATLGVSQSGRLRLVDFVKDLFKSSKPEVAPRG